MSAVRTNAQAPPETARRSRAWQAFKTNRLALASLFLLGMVAILAVLGKALTEWVVVFDPATVRLMDKFSAPLSEPSAGLGPALQPALGVYILGTDELGRDVFARMLQGSFVSLSIGFIAVGISLVIGVSLGALAGFFGERRLGPFSIDMLIMRFTDVMLCFPVFFLVLTVVAVLPPSIYNIMIVIGLTGWMSTARFVRAEFLTLREQDYVMAARALGLPPARIMFVHMLPNALAPVMVSATIAVATAILTESALSFLGFGCNHPSQPGATYWPTANPIFSMHPGYSSHQAWPYF